MAYRKKTGGRKVGTPNIITADIKSMIREALIDLGGKEYLKAQAATNAPSFMTLLGKTIPAELEAKMKLSFEPLVIKQADNG